MTTTSLADPAAPGDLLRQVAGDLARDGLDVSPPGDGEGRLAIAGLEAEAVMRATPLLCVARAGRAGHG